MEQFFRLFFLLGLIGILTFLSGCGGDSTPPSDETEKPLKTVAIPRFDRDSAFRFVEKQLDFGPRVPNSEAHRRCKEWLVRQFKSFGARVIEQDFQAKAYTGEMLDGTNIIAQFKPGRKKRILLAAHWDTRHIADSKISTERRDEPIPGADDGGSGVAVLLEVARQLHENPIEMGVDIILFDAEDYGESNGEQSAQDSWCLGSQYWARNLHRKGYRPKYGILLDMVGAKGARFGKEQFSMNFAPKVMNKMWKLAKNMGYGNYFVDVRTNAVTDDHYYVNTIAKIPMIDVINKPLETQTGFGSYWHTHNDNMKVIDKRTLRAVGQVVLAVTYREANGTF